MTDPARTEDRTISVTTVETNDRRHLVQPYAEKPVVELSEGVVACPFCGNPRFRRSRLRFSDLAELLLLRYPVRCIRCSQRQFVYWNVALLAYPPKRAGQRTAGGSDSWRHWTDPALAQGQRVTRPLSTALGPRARHLEPAVEADGSAVSSRIASHSSAFQVKEQNGTR